jgi:hypothetical protein
MAVIGYRACQINMGNSSYENLLEWLWEETTHHEWLLRVREAKPIEPEYCLKNKFKNYDNFNKLQKG